MRSRHGQLLAATGGADYSIMRGTAATRAPRQDAAADADAEEGTESLEMDPLLESAEPESMRAAPPADGSSGLYAMSSSRRRAVSGCTLLLLAALALTRQGRVAKAEPRRHIGDGGCAVGDTHDCNGVCAPKHWIGDGWCDIGTDGRDLNCSVLEYDGGDCAADARPARLLQCVEGDLLDCHGNCFPSHWLGDNDCDDPDEEQHMVFLNCAALRYDDGDCVLDERGCEEGYVPAPCVVEELGLPRFCVPAEWLGDGTCDVLIQDGYVSQPALSPHTGHVSTRALTHI